MQYPPPQQQPPLQPAKKKGSGCLLALAIGGGILLIVGIVGGIVVYRAVTSPEGQKAVSLIGEGAKIAVEAANAPGTKELRDLGCTQATVVDMDRVEALSQLADPDASRIVPPKKEFRLMVTCQVRKTDGAPTCDQVATAYRVAVTAPAGRYVAAVGSQHTQKPLCSALYGQDGIKIRDMSP